MPDRRFHLEHLLARKDAGGLSLISVKTHAQAVAAVQAGCDLVSLSPALSSGPDFQSVRRLLPDAFLVAELPPVTYASKPALRDAAYHLIRQNADALYCPYEPGFVDAITREGIPVIAHLGVQAHSAAFSSGGAVGLTAKDAYRLYKTARNHGAAGAFGLILERLPAKIAGKISLETGLLTFSKGSGDTCHGQAVSADALLGLEPSDYTRAYRDHAAEYAKLQQDTLEAVREFQADVSKGRYPAAEFAVETDDETFETFMFALEKLKKKKH